MPPTIAITAPTTIDTTTTIKVGRNSRCRRSMIAMVDNSRCRRRHRPMPITINTTMTSNRMMNSRCRLSVTTMRPFIWRVQLVRAIAMVMSYATARYRMLALSSFASRVYFVLFFSLLVFEGGQAAYRSSKRDASRVANYIIWCHHRDQLWVIGPATVGLSMRA